MDSEDSSEFEEEEEEEQEDDDSDDELMLFILPALYLATTKTKTPAQTSKVSDATGIETKGQVSGFGDAKWVCKVLEDDRGQGYGKLRVEPHILLELSRFLRSNNLLRNTKGVSVEGKIGIFIYMLSRNASFQKLNDRFKVSKETIHRHIKACFDLVTTMTGEFVKPPSTQPHPKISSDPFYGPYFEVSITYGCTHCYFLTFSVTLRIYFPFQNCIGVIDGIHVPMTLSDSEAAPYRNRQESISQNVMFACDFDLNFVYVSSGQGSASDAAVLYSAITSGFQVPSGKYYLVDRGYPNTPFFLAPYIEVPYHTEEHSQSNIEPRDYRELFNLRHAQLHGHIKRALGLLKMRFPILNVATSYRKDTQLKIPAAAVVLHNVLQLQGGDEEVLSDQTVPFASRKTVALPTGDDTYGYDVAAFNNECNMGIALRDDIAQRMWTDYERSMYA